MIYLANKEYEKAIADFEQYHKLIGHPLKGLSSLGHAYAAAGRPDKAQECLDKLREREKLEPNVILHMDFAFIYSGMKDFDNAFYYLNKTYEQRIGIACLGIAGWHFKNGRGYMGWGGTGVALMLISGLGRMAEGFITQAQGIN